MLPVPSLLLGQGPGGRFNAWYPGQEEALRRVLDWLPRPIPLELNRFLCLSIPTGSGKSLIAILSAALSGRPAVILTATKGLQAQICRDFPDQVVDIRGQNSYQCLLDEGETCDLGPCHSGFNCPHRDHGCLYYDKLRQATKARIVVTNYAYWLSQNEYSDGIGDRDLLIMDESHLAFSALESHLATHIEPVDIEPLGIDFPRPDPEEWSEWVVWADAYRPRVSRYVDKLKDEIKELRDRGDKVPRSEIYALRSATVLERKLGRIETSEGRWIAEKAGSGWTYTPVWLDEYAPLLYNNVGKVVAMSAILTEGSADHLAIPAGRDFLSMPSLFPVQNTPVLHISTVRMNHRVTPADLEIWLNRIDQIIDRRQDRKGIIFTVSYDRRNLIMNHSRHAGIMISHGQRDVVEMVNRFKRGPSPAVLVSPSVTSGWDFPGDQCEYIIIGKLPYPDTRSALVKARLADDDTWTSFIAMQTLIQSAGRGTRSMSDVCEVIIVDDSWRWFWPRYKQFAPAWFHQRIRGTTDLVPNPPVIP